MIAKLNANYSSTQFLGDEIMHATFRNARNFLARAILLTGMVVGSAAVAEAAVPVPLSLINGWYDAPFSTNPAAITVASNIVHFQGAIGTGGTNHEPFIIPAQYRPAVIVFVQLDLCNSTAGRIIIYPSGDTYIQPETNFSNAQCFTSLEGVSYALVPAGFKPIALLNGWTATAYGTGPPTVKKVANIVRLKGAIGNGTTLSPFVLPAADRPPTNVHIPIDLCNGIGGALLIQPSGVATIEPDNGSLSSAQCFTSLDGAWFAANQTGYTILGLLNGWQNGTGRPAAAKKIAGMVHFEGAIQNGSSQIVFVLPKALAPKSADAYVPVELCGGYTGRLHIAKNGTVDVQAGSSFSNAQCYVSLDGASYIP
jgi:hypothetical protein